MATVKTKYLLTHNVNIRVSEREHKAIHDLAYKHRTSASDVMRNLWQLYEQQQVAAKIEARRTKGGKANV